MNDHLLDVKSRASSMSVETRSHPSLGYGKRFIDVVLSAIALIALSPLMALIAVLIKSTSPGPIFYRRTLLGYLGHPFVMLKFRSMVNNAHESMKSDSKLYDEYRQKLKISNDPRITPLGEFLRRLSLDELPQLINVFRGEMSLVGPRMLGDIELAQYGQLHEKVLSVKPGLTGLWQISGRHRTSMEERISLDMYYIDNWSLGLDLYILIKTPLVVLSMAGAS
jgi:lipopolysaccharide/colanic/teichoic acid biosynthesis glycosyltransferase